MYRRVTGGLLYSANCYRVRHISVRSAPPDLPQGRHKWTQEQDAQLRELVEAKGHSWKAIASELGIRGSPSKVRRRWEMLQPMLSSMWAKSEDSDLAQSIQKYTESGRRLGEYGSWVAVARMLKTDRTPRQCFTRWTRTLLPRQGKALAFTRLGSIRGWGWSENESALLTAAVAGIEQVQDPAEIVSRARKHEPWLLVDRDPEGQFLPQYWMFIASCVGTRTAPQCKAKWQTICKRVQPASAAAMSLDEVKTLAQLVKIHGNAWDMLAAKFFSGRTLRELRGMYIQWSKAEKRFAVDLLDIDPFSMIRDHKGNSAMRPTGNDGYYCADGQVVRVGVRGKHGPLTPYFLALKYTKPIGRGRADVTRVVGLSSRGNTRLLSNEVIDKLVAAISLYKNDWVSISREVGFSIPTCRRYAESLADRLMSIQAAISDCEMDKLAASKQEQVATNKQC
ncbi:hypothetical protein GGI09_005144 [Coemansia sp. S100]|nr:hypothetical protein GGI09_005144 [Coemansia sp. S100]